MIIIRTDKRLRERDERDFYPTPLGLVRAAMQIAADGYGESPRVILDPGAGAGVWGRVAREVFPDAVILGVDPHFDRPAQNWYDRWWKEDLLSWKPPYFIDLVIGNPPYSLAEPFVRKSLELVRPGGVVVQLLRMAFLAGQKRGAGLWQETPLVDVHISSRRPSFTGDGKVDDNEYALYTWQNGALPRTRLGWFTWNYDPVEDMWGKEKEAA